MRGSHSFENHDYLHAYVLDRSVKCLESILKSERIGESSTHTNGTNIGAGNQHSKEHSLTVLNKDLFYLLLANMIQQRNNEEGMAPVAKKKGAKGSGSGSNSGSASGLSNIQLVFRGMLGCVRVEVARGDSSSGAGNSSTGSSSSINGTLSRSQPSVDRAVSSSSARETPLEREREREQAALCYNVHGIFYSAFERERLLESDKKDTEDSDRHTTLGKITKKFMKLLMNLQKETSCKDACPIIVAMFTEIINALSGAAKLTGKLIRI